MKKEAKTKESATKLEDALLLRLGGLNFHAPAISEFKEVVPLLFSCTLSVKRNYKPFANVGLETEIDFAWPEVKIGIEVNGGIDSYAGQGRLRPSGHNTPEGLRRDYYKTNLAQIEGWILLTFPPEYCTDDQQASVGIRLLRAAFKLRGVELK